MDFNSNASLTPAAADLDDGFEGPEKTLNALFVPASPEWRSLRTVTRERWSQMLELARCQILSVMSNAHCDAYVLSESSLFVFDSHVVLKTCGTTRLLLGLDDIVGIASGCGQRARAVFYTRKNFTFPVRQTYPHTSFADERAFLDARYGGSSVVAGPLSDDHWYFYAADLAQPGDEPISNTVFEVRMHELHPEAAAGFFNTGEWTGKDVTLRTGIGALLPGMAVDEHLFEPCGYSMNGLLAGPWYATIHVTPESNCSYASFETNLPLGSYDALLASVLAIFRPSTFTAHVMGPSARSYEVTAAGCSQPSEGASAELVRGVDVRTWNFVAAADERRERRLMRGITYVVCSTPNFDSSPTPDASSPPMSGDEMMYDDQLSPTRTVSPLESAGGDG
eukprot:m51a1_g12354 putative s-adenosylmethionine decarboxylase (394) ;mRNA; f:546236-547417